jgi:hypothetical protein
MADGFRMNASDLRCGVPLQTGGSGASESAPSHHLPPPPRPPRDLRGSSCGMPRKRMFARQGTTRQRRDGGCGATSSSPARAGPSDDSGDSDPDGEHHPLTVRETAGWRRDAPLQVLQLALPREAQGRRLLLGCMPVRVLGGTASATAFNGFYRLSQALAKRSWSASVHPARGLAL